MMSMPFAIVGTFGGLAYRTIKREQRRQAALKAEQESQDADSVMRTQPADVSYAALPAHAELHFAAAVGRPLNSVTPLTGFVRASRVSSGSGSQ